MKKLYKVILLLLMIFLVIGTPTKGTFMEAVKEDFMLRHPGISIGTDLLSTMGSASYKTYLLWSSFSYQFGNVTVKYLGIGFMTFYLGSEVTPAPDFIPEDDVQRS